VEESDRLGLDKSDDSNSSEIGSSDVRVSDRKRVERSGGLFGACRSSDVSGQVARRICNRSSRSSASRTGLVSLRAAEETRRMVLSTLGTMPASFSLEKVRVCNS
jgi:hypothetical protein